MKKDKFTLNREIYIEAGYYLLLFAAMMFFVLLQPLGEPPDESGRYKIAQYICLYGTLPHGAAPEILLHGYGGSYGFQPILTYIIQGYIMRFLFQFTHDGYLLLLAARMVNVVFGMIMAVYVRKISKILFCGKHFQWLFCVAVMMLPESLFMHTYVNTDSMAIMSNAIMVYAWLIGLRTKWDLRSCLTLSIGISLCALSYYNAYGFILCSIFVFIYTFLDRENGKWSFAYKPFLQKGLLISAVVLLCIAWWFIRNAILYDGDFLGLNARALCTLETATEKYHPATKETYYNTGYSLWYMLFKTDFMELLSNSFIATFGPMSIVTFEHIYTIFKWLFAVSFIGLFLPLAKPFSLSGYTQKENRCLHANMLLSIAIPVFLCVFYSYASDYQPQGRYILVMIVPFGYYFTLGIQKIIQFIKERRAYSSKTASVVCTVIILYFQYALWLTLIKIVFPVYYGTSILRYIRHEL